jgi:ComF family protein
MDRMNALKQKCIVCDKGSLYGQTHRSCSEATVIDYTVGFFKYNKVSRKIIHELKYRFSTQLQNYISNLIKRRLRFFRLPKKAIITSVPLHPSRKKWRGFNQSELLAKELAELKDWEFQNLLVRNKHTTPQAQTKLKERKKNIEGVFKLASNLQKTSLKNNNIIVFDDIITTGSTIKECCQQIAVLKPKTITAISFLIT